MLSKHCLTRKSVLTRTQHVPLTRLVCSSNFDFNKFANQKYLDEAAKRFRVGLEYGMDENELLALELGSQNDEGLSEVQIKYKEKVKEKLIKRAEELQKEEEERKAAMSKNFNLGKLQYESGEYAASVVSLENAVRDAAIDIVLQGEIQLWLALAYQACGREEECIELYKQVENSHPVKKIRKQAAELRYIMEAPKLQIGEDERVTIPLLQTDAIWRPKEQKRRSFARGSSKAETDPSKKTYWDNVDWDIPILQVIPDKWYYRVLWAAIFVGSTIYLNWRYG